MTSHFFQVYKVISELSLRSQKDEYAAKQTREKMDYNCSLVFWGRFNRRSARIDEVLSQIWGEQFGRTKEILQQLSEVKPMLSEKAFREKFIENGLLQAMVQDMRVDLAKQVEDFSEDGQKRIQEGQFRFTARENLVREGFFDQAYLNNVPQDTSDAAAPAIRALDGVRCRLEYLHIDGRKAYDQDVKLVLYVADILTASGKVPGAKKVIGMIYKTIGRDRGNLLVRAASQFNANRRMAVSKKLSVASVVATISQRDGKPTEEQMEMGGVSDGLQQLCFGSDGQSMVTEEPFSNLPKILASQTKIATNEVLEKDSEDNPAEVEACNKRRAEYK